MLRDIEAILLKPGDNPYDAKELRLILDRVVAGLARFGTPGARKAVVEHALKRKTELGDTMSRLTELAGQDLSEDPQTVEKLIASLKSNLPFKLLGLVLHQNDQNLAYTIEALSSTPLPAVRQAFEEVLKRFPGSVGGARRSPRRWRASTRRRRRSSRRRWRASRETSRSSASPRSCRASRSPL